MRIVSQSSVYVACAAVALCGVFPPVRPPFLLWSHSDLAFDAL